MDPEITSVEVPRFLCGHRSHRGSGLSRRTTTDDDWRCPLEAQAQERVDFLSTPPFVSESELCVWVHLKGVEERTRQQGRRLFRSQIAYRARLSAIMDFFPVTLRTVKNTRQLDQVVAIRFSSNAVCSGLVFGLNGKNRWIFCSRTVQR